MMYMLFSVIILFKAIAKLLFQSNDKKENLINNKETKVLSDKTFHEILTLLPN